MKRTESILLCLCLLLSLLPSLTAPAFAIGSYGVNLTGSAYQSNTNPFYKNGYGSSAADGAGGQCTWYVWGRVYEKLNIKLPYLGNAKTWDNSLKGTYAVGTTAKANSILVNHSGTYGHVMFVEKVADGYAYITEVNYKGSDTPTGKYHEDKIKLSTMTRSGGGVITDYAFVYLGEAPSYYLDLNGWYNGKLYGNFKDWGTCDLSINGTLAADDVSDHYTAYEAGTAYTVSNIKAKEGYTFGGFATGKISGTISGTTKITLLFFDTKPQFHPSEGQYMLYSALASNRAVNITGKSTAAQANVELAAANSSSTAQIFTFQENGAWYMIQNKNSGLFLDVAKYNRNDNANVWQYSDNGGGQQHWRILDAGDGTFYLQSRLGTFMETADGASAAGTNIQASHLKEETAQKWKLVRTDGKCASGHSWDDGVVTAPSCLEKGTRTYTCSVCGSTLTEAAEPQGHNYVNGVCTRCGEKDPDYVSLEAPVISLTPVTASGKTKVSWAAVEGAVQYEVWRTSEKEAEDPKPFFTTKLSYVNTAARAGDKVWYRVRAIDANGSAGAFSSSKYRICDLAQPVVTGSNVAATGKNKLTWEAIEGATGYEIYRSTSKASGYELLKTAAATATSFTNTGAAAGTTYYYKVVAIHENTAANSAESAVVTRTCDLPRPVVTGTHVASTGKNKLTWKAVDGAVSYKVYRSDAKDSGFKLMKTTTGLSYVNTGAEAGETWYYKVVAVHEKSAANSAYSAIKTLTCDLARPVVTSGLSGGLPKLSWAAVAGAKQYKVYRAGSESGSYSLKYTGTAKAFIDAEAVSGKTYWYKVMAVHEKAAANSAYSVPVSVKTA